MGNESIHGIASVSPPSPTDDAAIELRTLRDAAAFFVRQPSPQLIGLAIIGFLIPRIYAGRWHAADAIAVVVVAGTWHIQERLLHECILHMKARPILGSKLSKRLSEYHQRHHRDPWRTQTMFINMRAYPFTIPGVFGVLLVITRDLRFALTGSVAYFVTLLCYEWTHFLIHTSYSPRSEWYRRRWWNHRLHHFKNRRYWYGITSPLWDKLMRSQPDPSRVEMRKDWRGPNPIT